MLTHLEIGAESTQVDIVNWKEHFNLTLSTLLASRFSTHLLSVWTEAVAWA
jgi:hypothetical protein